MTLFYQSLASVSGDLATSHQLLPVGFDTEYTTATYSGYKAETLCVIQEAFVDPRVNVGFCLVLPLWELSTAFTGLPDCCARSLENGNLLYFGNAVATDLLRCIRQIPSAAFYPPSIDFHILLRLIDPHKKILTSDRKLYTLCERLLGVKGSDSFKTAMQLSNWQRKLTKSDILYAAMDAIVSCELGLKFVAKLSLPLPVTLPEDRKLEEKSRLAAAAGSVKPTAATIYRDVLAAWRLTGQRIAPRKVPSIMKWILNSYSGIHAFALQNDSKLLQEVATLWDADEAPESKFECPSSKQ